jgi:chromosome segregation ATPase
MDLEQLSKQLEWLDDERRKDKTTIAALEKRLGEQEGKQQNLMQQVAEVASDLSRFSASLARFDQVETTIAQAKVDFGRSVESIEKARNEHDREIEKVRRADNEQVNKAIADTRKGLEPISEIKRNLSARVEEEYRLGRLIDEIQKKFTDYTRSDEEYRRSIKLLEDGYRQDSKRLTDLHGEVAAIRKRADEQRGKIEIANEMAKKIDTRVNDLVAGEADRRQTQQNFLEKQALLQVERDRTWKDWQSNFEDIGKSSVTLDAQLQTLDTTMRSVKRSQESFEEITQRFERRINEITEIQRLNEDRFRQEWVSYKADDQKRWTNYSISQEEQNRESARHLDKLNERLVSVEDAAQDIQDLVHQVNEEASKRLQSLLVLAHDWIENYNRTFAGK